MPKEKVDIALRVSRTENTSVSLSHFDDLFLFQEAKQHGCRNVLALRGDPPAGKEEWEAVDGGFVYGIDLVAIFARSMVTILTSLWPAFLSTSCFHLSSAILRCSTSKKRSMLVSTHFHADVLRC